jgi:1-deoxy-D-xylulose-5-phosphate reductoisomerase
MKRIAILGSTGSIGTQTLDVLQQFPEAFEVVGLAAGGNVDLLARQVEAFRPSLVSVSSEEGRDTLMQKLAMMNLPHPVEVLVGHEGLLAVATHSQVDTVVVGLVGFVGLQPTLQALEQGKQVLTANKETFVTAGHLVQPYLSRIVPLDSEHSAIFQCLQGTGDAPREVEKIYLTASGGPFREYSLEDLRHVTVAQALKHPNWSMGDRVTIDSATMMNKGFEIIEAHHLFALPLDRIEVVVHPQSIVHSAVAFVDGSILAQMGQPDMRVPIQYGLTWPQRWPIGFPQVKLDLTRLGMLKFSPADPERFPCLRLARWAAEVGGTLPVVLNAADEMAVNAFLQGHVAFMDIPRLIEELMRLHLVNVDQQPSLDRIVQVDTWTRAAFEDVLVVQTR